ncbi:ABC transporter permease [Catellatospora methionotrophica]|uniref:ABC transporter permease n=1 Tax=Catellatospora methionotrophica TaxID=121620 RepID=UPI003407067D
MNLLDQAAGDHGWRLARTFAFGWSQFWVLNPPVVLVTTLLPRAVMQALFFTMLGRYVGGPEHAGFVLVATPAITLPLMCTVNIVEVIMVEKWSGTFWRVRRGRVHPVLVLALRAWPFAAVGLVTSLIALLAAGLVVGFGDLGRHLPGLVPIYALMAVSMCAAGLAGTALALGRRADIVVGNLLAYLVILASGAFLPIERLGALQPLAWLLPGSHAVAAARAIADDQPWATQVVLEAAVGACWLAVAAVAIWVQLRRARRHGHDDFV